MSLRKLKKKKKQSLARTRKNRLPKTSLDVNQELKRALQLQQANQLQQAEEIYKNVLALVPDHAYAIHELGHIALTRKDYHGAIRLINKAIRLNSKDPVCFNNLGLAFRGLGKPDQAVIAYKKALSLGPNIPEILINLGSDYRTLGKLDKALDCFRKARRLKPGIGVIHLSLGLLHRDLGNPDRAIVCFNEALRINPGYAEAYNGKGSVLQALGRLEEAVSAFTAALRITPDHPAIHNNLGLALSGSGRTEDAVIAYKKALAASPDFYEALLNLGNAYKTLGKADEALACYQKARQLRPEAAVVLHNMGSMHKELGNLDQAITCFREAVRLDPENSAAYHGLGAALQEKGEMAAAVSALRNALRIRPDDTDAYALLVGLKKYASVDHQDVRNCKTLLERSGLNEKKAVDLYFALGKIHDDCGFFDQAFEYYQEGNRLVRNGLRDSLQTYREQAGKTMATFTDNFFTGLKQYGSLSELPVFIVGMPRSGTTLVEQIIASHTLVHGADELIEMDAIVREITSEHNETESYQVVADIDDQALAALAQRYLAVLKKDAPGHVRRISDKMPGNFMLLGWIALLFPNARVIHCCRHPYDTCLSIFFQNFKYKRSYWNDLAELGQAYLEYERVMAHWREVLPLEMIDIHYEELIADPEGKSRELIRFLGLDWDEKCLSCHKTDRVVRTASAWQVRQPFYSSSVNRWRNYEQFLGPLRESLGPT